MLQPICLHTLCALFIHISDIFFPAAEKWKDVSVAIYNQSLCTPLSYNKAPQDIQPAAAPLH